MSEDKDLLNLLDEAIKKKLKSLNYKDDFITAINAGAEKKADYNANMESTSDKLKKPMTLVQKSLLSAGGLALLAGLIKPGKQVHSLLTSKEIAKRTADVNSRIADKYKNVMNASNQAFNKELADAMARRKVILDPKYKKPSLLNPFNLGKRLSDKAERTLAEKGWDVSSIEARRMINQANVSKDRLEEVADAISELAGKHKEIGDSLSSRHLKHLDTILPVAGALSVAGGLMSKKAEYNFNKEEKLPFQATKESQELPKVLIRPDLVKEPTYYTRGFQSGPIIENANKMDKIATAITSIHNGELNLKDGTKVPYKSNAKQLSALLKAIKENPGKHITANKDGSVKIAEAVNSLFPKEPTDPRDIQLEKQEKVLSKQEKAIIKRDEMLAQHEQAHAEKDMKLKELQKAIKQVNGHAQHYRAKAIEHFTNSLDAEVAGTPGR
jgi:hypothetical protein